MTNQIDIFADKPEVTDAYIAAVTQAKADHPEWILQWTYKKTALGSNWYSSEILSRNWDLYIFRIHPQHKPKIAAGWNPQGLTEEQVGVKDGWRLLTLEECKENKVYDDLEFFSKMENRWDSATSLGGFAGICHRTKHPLPQPKKRVPLTMDDLPPVFWVRIRDTATWFLVGKISYNKIELCNGSVLDYENLLLGYEYSIDRKEVKPFWKEE